MPSMVVILPSRAINSVIGIIHNHGPELDPFGLLDPQPQNFPLAVGIERERHLDGLVLDHGPKTTPPSSACSAGVRSPSP